MIDGTVLGRGPPDRTFRGKEAVRISIALSGERVTPPLAEHFDGVGLLRGEYVFRRAGRYPSAGSVADHLAPYLRDVAASIRAGQRVWYRFLEVDTAEANVLDGVEEVIRDEPNRLMGLRGIRRARRHPEHFRAELAGVAGVAGGGDRVGVILPFVSELAELEWGVAEIRRLSPTLPVATMVEVPSALIQLDDLLRAGVERAVIGVNDLSSLLCARARVVAGPIEPVPGLVAAIELARAATARHGADLVVAGYLSHDLLDVCEKIGVDEAAVHYSDLPRLFGDRWADLEELGLLHEIKRRTKRDIAEFEATAVGTRR